MANAPLTCATISAMDVVSTCPLRVGSIVWRSAPGAWVLTVVCKATYALKPGESPLAREQDEINEGDGYWNDDESRSLHVASDLAPFKVRGDVLLTGHAFAPGGRPVRSLVARMIVAGVDKSIEVFGDRAWTIDGSLREGARFVKMPLRWERAAGGPGLSNPVGMRADGAPDAYGARAVPNLQPPGVYVAMPGEFIEPIGFSPVAPTWEGRARMLHRYAAAWSHQGWNEGVLPSDIDARFFNAAPVDQQVEAIRGDERLVLENLHPEHPRLVTNLQAVTPRGSVERAGGAKEEIALRCDTLCVDTDRGVCTLVWRGQVGIWHPRDAGRVVITTERSAREDEEGEVSTTLLGVRGDAKPALPFVQGSPWAAGVAVPTTPVHQREEGDGTGTIFGVLGPPPREVMPFAAAPQPVDLPLLEQPRAGLEMPYRTPVIAAFEPTPLVPVAAPEPFEREESALEPAPAEPPWIGPLATPEMALRGEKAVPPVEPEKPTPNAATEPTKQGALPLDEFPLERCAAIAASMARRKPDAARILEENRLTSETWVEIDRHWNEAIRAEIRRGKVVLLEAYDTAYVGRLEAERGPLLVAEYARLVVAKERGTVGEVLAELTLPKGAMMRVEREWLRRMGDDVRLAGGVDEAVETARGAR